jgi:hypothetical protein
MVNSLLHWKSDGFRQFDGSPKVHKIKDQPWRPNILTPFARSRSVAVETAPQYGKSPTDSPIYQADLSDAGKLAETVNPGYGFI